MAVSRFKLWRTIDGKKLAPKATLEPVVVIHGVFKPQRFRDFLQHFIIFEEGADFGVLHKLSRALLDGAHA